MRHVLPFALLALLALALPAVPAEASPHLVTVFNFGYTDTSSSTPVTVAKVGDAVTWVWVSGVHTVTHGAAGAVDPVIGGGFESGVLAAGSPTATFTHTFGEPGVYEYYCKLHVTMRGIVVVEP